MSKIIALWAHPRSMSTATERIMRERGDLICLHEPFMHAHYSGIQDAFPGYTPLEGHPIDYVGVAKMLLDHGQQRRVFFKDMAYYVLPDILQDLKTLRAIRHTFLIRSPVASILSYYKLDPDFTLKDVGVEAQWQLYEAACAQGQTPVVLDAESVRADPKAMMQSYWQKVGLDYTEAAFEWQAPPTDWKHVSAWHEDAMTTSGIRTADAEEILRKEMEFDALAERVPHLRDYLNHHAPFYQKLSAVALAL